MRLLLATTLLTTATIAVAQDLPSPEALDRLVAEALPSYWETENFETIVTSRDGDAANPGAVVRFEVDAISVADLFAEAGREGPFVIVVPTETAATRRRLYGVHDLTYRAGQWSGDVIIENPIDGLGQPKDLFGSPVLVLGDEETEARLEALRNTAVAGAAARQEAALARLRGSHEQAVAELEVEHQVRLADLRKMNAEAVGEAESAAAEALAAAEAEGTRSVARLTEDYETQRAELTETTEPALAQARAERETLLAVEQEATREALTQARNASAEELETLARLRGSHEQAVAELEAEHQGRLADLRKMNAEAVGEAESAAAEALATAEAEGTRSVARLTEDYETQRAELTESTEPALAQSRAERETLLAAEQEATQEALTQARDASAEELETLRAEHAERRGNMIEAQRQEMAELETMLATERASLERQVEAGEEVVLLQAQLSTLLEERAAGAIRQMDAFDAARQARVDFFARLPRNWSGQVRCLSEDGQQVDRTTPVSFNFQGFTSNGVNAGINLEGDDFSGGQHTSFVFLDEALSFPIIMRGRHEISSSRTIIPSDFDIMISQDGRMSGERTLQWTVDQRPVDVTCTFRIAAA